MKETVEELRTINQRVKKLMECNYDARCSDRVLECYYYEKYYDIDVFETSAYDLLMNKHIPKVSSIERAGRIVRATYPELTVAKVQVARCNKEPAFIQMSQDERI